MRRIGFVSSAWFLALGVLALGVLALGVLALGVLAPSALLRAQQPLAKDAAPAAPIPMPSDRAGASYRIYSMLMPVGELGGRDWPHGLWLLADTTVTLVQPDQPCIPEGSEPVGMNPHVALQPPPDQAQDYAELLEDFDRHCHDRILLTAEPFKVAVPLRVLTKQEQDEFMATRFAVPGANKVDPAVALKYEGAPGLSSFSEVYFNAHHTVAMVYGWGWCGGLCGQGFWSVFALKDGEWKSLRWNSSIVMS